MKVLQNIFKEVFGLFVEDGSLAVAILLWVAFALFLLPLLVQQSWLLAAIWIFGLLIILLENVYRKGKSLPAERGH